MKAIKFKGIIVKGEKLNSFDLWYSKDKKSKWLLRGSIPGPKPITSKKNLLLVYEYYPQ